MDNRSAWEQKYQIKSLDDVPEPAGLLLKNAGMLGGGTALDIAMGAGQNSVFLAQRGFSVTGVDRSPGACDLARQLAEDRGVAVETVMADMLEWEFPENRFDLIMDFYFLERALVPRIKAGLKKGGLLFFETYTLDQQRFDGPHNPDFLLRPNELLTSFLDLLVLYYHERISPDGKGGHSSLASLVAKKL